MNLYLAKSSFAAVGLAFSCLSLDATAAASLYSEHSVHPTVESQPHTGITASDIAQIRQFEYVVLGELHGTNEGPAFAGELVERMASNGARVLVAVELSAADNERLQQIWNGSHSAFAEDLIDTGWHSREDGVASRAMFAMLVRLHALRSTGANIGIVAFNGFRDQQQQSRLDTPNSQAGHERAQAENIISAFRGGRFDHAVILVGSNHARIIEVEIFGDRFRPMAMHLRSEGRSISFVMATSGGEAWNCRLRPDVQLVPGQPITDEMVVCGGDATRPNRPVGLEQQRLHVPHLGIAQPVGIDNAHAYDGYFWVGQITASPPAVP